MPCDTIRVVRADLISESSLELVQALNQELRALYPEPGATHFSLDPNEVAEGHGAFCVVEDDGTKIGCGAVRLIDADTAELKRMYVVPSRRGEGIARQLLAALEAEARALGARRLVLETGVHQEAALALYRKNGFRTIPLYGEYCASPKTSVCLGKELPPPPLLNDDGSASIATAVLMSHHGLRRDLACFHAALARMDGRERTAEVLQAEWHRYRMTLHGHHEAEDNRMFPHLRAVQPALLPVLERLTAEHALLEPLLERGDRAFAALPNATLATAVLAELSAVLERHLAFEEATVIPLFREVKTFPLPPSDEELDLFLSGFAWSYRGVAPEVLDQVNRMLPEAISTRLPAARAAHEARVQSVFGPAEPVSRTSTPGR